MSSSLKAWQVRYLDELESADNDRLMNMFEEAIIPDTHDGCYTTWGEFYLEKSGGELYKRLIECGFLSKQ
jgi:hypothetical protein